MVVIYSSSIGLTNSWVWVSENRIKLFVCLEAVPKFIVGFFFLSFIRDINDVIHYFIILTITNVVCSGLPIIGLMNQSSGLIRFPIKTEILYGLARMVQSLYFAAFLPIANLLHVRDLTNFAFIERLYRMTMSAIAPVSQYISAEVVRNAYSKIQILKRAIQISLVSNSILILVCSPIFSKWFFNHTINLNLIFFSFIGLSTVVTFNRLFSILFMSKSKLQNKFSFLLLGCSIVFIVTLFPMLKFFQTSGIVIAAIVAELFYFLIGLRIEDRS